MVTEQKVIETVGKAFWDHWHLVLVIVGIVLVLLLVSGIVYYIFKRKKAQAAKNSIETKKEPLKSSALRKIWKNFLKEMPGDLRRHTMVFDHFIVFGGWSSGKTTLIDHYTDWQGYAREFYPSYTTNPLLQIYLGSKALVQEIPASLLSDTSSDVRKALFKLWKPIFRHQTPTVVLVLNGILASEEDHYIEYLTREAQYLRGKINILSAICKKPVRVRIAVTHLDLMEGFSEFSEYLVKKGISLNMHLSSNDDISDLSMGLEPYEKYLTDTLLTLPADQYLKAISFLRGAPKLFEHLKFFAGKLTGQDPLSAAPQIVDICLTSLEENKARLSNPFAAHITREQLEKFDPYRRHRRIASALGLIALSLLMASFLYELDLVKQRQQEASVLSASFSEGYERKIHDLLPDQYFEKHYFLRFTPDFFKENHQAISRVLVESIRRHYLYPRLDSYVLASGRKDMIGSLTKQMSDPTKHYIEIRESMHDKYIYVVGLLYATKSNALGKLMQGNIDHISESLSVPDMIIEDYINYNQPDWPIAHEIPTVSLAQRGNDLGQIEKMIAFHGRSYFQYISKLYNQPIINENDLDKLLHETDHFLMIIRQFDIHQFYIKLMSVLKQETDLVINMDDSGANQFGWQKDKIKQFLVFIKGSSLEPPQKPENLKFEGLSENIQMMLHYNKVKTDVPFKFSFGDEEYIFSPKKWNDALNRSKICVFLRRAVAYYKTPNGNLFFPSEYDFEDIVMNPTNDGGFLFIGKARVDKKFTKNAIERYVKPQVTDLPVLIKSLPVPDQDKTDFLRFFRREVDFYGQMYADSYRKFYLQFDIQINSAGALRFALNQMFEPSSSFMTFLQTIKENTQIEAGNNEYLMIIAGKMKDFQFIGKLLDEKNGVYPELDKYKILLDQMKTDLQQEEDLRVAGKNAADDPFSFTKSSLTPLGKIAFAINRQEKDSYLVLTNRWLESVGISRQWRDIFLAPIWTAYFLGMNEVEQKIFQSWSEITIANIDPLYNKFPFNPQAVDEATLDDIRNATHPQGRFWLAFQKTIAPYCHLDNGQWKKDPGPYGLPKLPSDLTATLSQISELGNRLWNKDGSPRPLEYTAKANPLPKVLPDEPVPVLAHVTIGTTSFLSFNQQTNWITFKVDWPYECAASVGLELIPHKGDVKYKSTVELPSTSWCFYKLLKKTEEYRDMARSSVSGGQKGKSYWLKNEIRWVIDPTSDKIKSHPMEIKLTFKKDPWELMLLKRSP
jgi:hypothetical protein